MKAAVVGLGPHGRRIIDVISSHQNLELVAVVEPNEVVLNDVDVSPTTARFLSAGDLWERGGVDLVCIATNGPSHAELCLGAIRSGAKRVLVEKPMATSVAECERMILEAQQSGVRLSVDQSRRHDPFYRWLRDSIRTGDLGEPRAMWVQRPGIGLGCLATHSFDLVEFLLGRETNRVTAWVDEPVGRNPRGDEFVDPGGTVVMELGGRIRAVVAQIEDGAGPMTVEIDLTGGRVRVDESAGQVEIISRDLSVRPGPGRPPRYEPYAVPDGLTPKIDMGLMLSGVLDELVSDRPTMECAAEHGRRAVEILVASYLSDRRRNQPITLPLKGKENLELCLPVT